jgi:FdhD protein
MSEQERAGLLAAGITEVSVLRFRGGSAQASRDEIAVEAPLEIRVAGEVLATTMRTPGSDVELVLGLLLSEGILRTGEGLAGVELEARDEAGGVAGSGVVEVRFSGARALSQPALASSRRGTLVSSACGVCGRLSIDDLLRGLAPADSAVQLDAAVLGRLPALLAAAQPNFARTGGLHAAGVARSDGALLVVREDVGRHNAVDKVLGRLLLDAQLPMASGVLVVSGRASFELVQKAATAGLSALVSVSAPSSLAIETAERVGLVLVGFARDGGFNVYAGRARLGTPSI